jgi:type II secretory pathway pseudopilin PulG
MKTPNPNHGGFTLIELVIVIGFFAFISAILMQNIFSVYHFKEVIRYKKDINFEASSVLSNGIPGLIRSGFAINYDETDSGNSVQPTEGMQTQTDRLTVYTDRAETQSFSIYRKPYSSSGDDSDTAQLVIKFSNEDKEYPLNSSETVVEDFDVEVPTDPRATGDSDLQPYVTIYLRVRHRYPFGELISEEGQEAYKSARASYRTTISLRNTSPSSYKTVPQT